MTSLPAAVFKSQDFTFSICGIHYTMLLLEPVIYTLAGKSRDFGPLTEKPPSTTTTCSQAENRASLPQASTSYYTKKVEKQLNDIREKLQILSSPTREILRNVEASLDYAIIAKSAQLEIVKLQRERLAMEARRTGSRRRIRNEDGGAYTIKSLRKQVSQRKRARILVEGATAEGTAPVDASGLKLRGRAAAKAKAEKEARDTAKWEEIKKSFINDWEIENQQRIAKKWNEVDDEEKKLMISTVPKSLLDGIPDLDKWQEDHPFTFIEDDEDVNPSPNAEDFISVASSLELPQLPRSVTSDSDDVSIIVSSQARASQKPQQTIQWLPLAWKSTGRKSKRYLERIGGWGYDRRPNNYSSREEVVLSDSGPVAGPAPKSP
ncbi:uncharacterized protein FPOAC1_014145 [Fusarium poae]|uniref:uncharacterized protein n=1 Tax=Fusarium poae TaxID=36050 RepID=UPI001D053B61|nr:uncharacterized protein FPOAC1_014145 [Fusarium poae]KAG8664078.1 hypothetical protein FPOAC1_014145 [Fusarium poae]